MKTIFKSFVLIAAAAVTLAGCTQKEVLDTPKDGELVTLKFNIHNADEGTVTKALLGTENGKNFLNWEDGDQIGTFSVGSFSGDQSVSNNNAGTVAVAGDNYTLNVQTYNAGNITNIYSYYPYSASAGKNKTAAVVTIPEAQTMSNSGFDADAMPMAGAPVTVSVTTAAANTDTPCGTINFSNLGSIIKFRVYSSVSTTETLTSVTYKATGIGGAFTIDLTAIDAEDEATLELTDSDVINEITTSVAGNPAISGLDNAIDVYMVVAPGDYTGSQVIVTTNAHTYTLDASGTKSFTRSHVKPIKVDIENGVQGDLPAAETWTKVTKASDFTAGTYYILRGDGAYYLPNAVASSGAPACVAYTAAATIPNAMRWTATEGTDGLIFESAANAGNYLWGWDKANGIRVTTTSPATGASKEWTFATLTANETTYYTAYAVSGRYLMSYGVQDWRSYASASSTNIPAEFYKLDDGKTALDTPTLSVSGTIVSWDPVANADHYVVSVNGGAGTDVTGISYDLDGSADGEYHVTVIAAPAANSTLYKNSAAASINVTIGEPKGTATNPYTVAEAITAIDNGNTSEVYVVGIISKITTAYNATYGNVSFDFSVDGSTEGSQFRAYRAVASSADEYVVGDGIIMKGTLTKYNTTYELEEGCTKYAQIHKPTMTAGTTFTDSQTVTISAESGVDILYTVDGTDPSTNGSNYTAALTLTETTTVKAVAVKDNMVTAIVSETFTKKSNTGGELAVDFESATSAYTDWVFSNMSTQQTNSNVTAHGGSYFGSTTNASGSGVSSNCYIQTANKIASPSSITFFISKQSTNTAASTWAVKVSSDGSNWTTVGDSQNAGNGITRGTWYEVTRNLSSYSNVYVRIEYSGSTAIRNIDDVTLTYN